MTNTATNWFVWAALSAVFAALTAIFAKIGLERIDSDPATLVRTAVILVVLAASVVATGKWDNPLALPSKSRLFLVLSGLAAGAFWVCHFRALKVGDASKVAPVDKRSVAPVALFAFAPPGERPAPHECSGHAAIGIGGAVLALK
jgi:transporter family protein